MVWGSGSSSDNANSVCRNAHTHWQALGTVESWNLHCFSPGTRRSPRITHSYCWDDQHWDHNDQTQSCWSVFESCWWLSVFLFHIIFTWCKNLGSQEETGTVLRLRGRARQRLVWRSATCGGSHSRALLSVWPSRPSLQRTSAPRSRSWRALRGTLLAACCQ